MPRACLACFVSFCVVGVGGWWEGMVCCDGDDNDDGDDEMMMMMVCIQCMHFHQRLHYTRLYIYPPPTPPNPPTPPYSHHPYRRELSEQHHIQFAKHIGDMLPHSQTCNSICTLLFSLLLCKKRERESDFLCKRKHSVHMSRYEEKNTACT